MTTENIDIVVREDGSRVVRRNLEDVGAGARAGADGVDRLQDSLKSLKTLMAGLGLGFGLAELIKYTDAWASLQGRLSLVTDSMEDMRRVQEQLFATAQRTRVSYEATMDLYTRISRATRDLNASEQDRLKVTESINKALIVSGASSEEAQRALIQLSQGLAAGTLRGQDLNSVLEQAPRLAQAIAEGLGKTQGDLKKMGEEGTLSAKAVFEALLSQGQQLDSEFQRMPQTIGQSFTLLKNEVLKFVGQTSEANGTAGNFAAVLALVANHLDLIAAAIQGVLVYKASQYFLDTAAALIKKFLALVDSTNALAAERAATLAAAEASAAKAAADVAVANAQLASIETSRTLYNSRLQEANANIRSAQAAMAAAEAAGAQSFAMRVLRESTQSLAVAEAERAAAMGALAVLGQQQAKASAQIAAATAAETAATTALAGARSAAVVGAGLARGALALLGGPIGLITTALTLGATAWALWGNKSKDSSQQAQDAVSETHEQIMQKLDVEIKKLQERNRLLGVNPDLGNTQTNPKAQAAQDDQARILSKINEVSKDSNLTDLQRTEILRVLGAQYNEATQRLGQFKTAQDQLTTTMNGDKVKQWLDKHQEYMSKTEQLAVAIKEAQKDLGDAFTPEIQKRITDALSKKDNQHDALLAYKETIEELKMRQKLEAAIAEGAVAHAQAQYSQGDLSQLSFLKAQHDAEMSENQRMIDFVVKELEVTKGAGKEQVAARAQYNGELAVLAQQRLNKEQAYNDTVEGLYSKRTQQEIDQGYNELAAINQQNQGLINKIKYFQMLPDAITAATVAELENQKTTLENSGFSDPAKLDAITAKIAALKRLAGNQSITQQQEYDWNMAQQVGQQWKQTGDIIANSLTTAFGKGGQALGKMVQGYSAFGSAEAELRKQYNDRVKVAAGDAKRIHDAEVEYTDATVQAKYEAYANMAGAAKDYFGQQTAAYKVLQGVEQAYRLMEIAMAYESMVRKILFSNTVTANTVANVAAGTAANVASVAPNVAADSAKASASGIAAVAGTLASLPFPLNLAAGATVLGLLVSLGVKMSGGGGSSLSLSQQRQAAQGTGTVLGDTSKQSDSISKALSHMSSNSDVGLTHTESMMHSLQNIQDTIGGFAALLVRSTNISNPNVNLNTNNGFATTVGRLGVTAGGAAIGGMAGAGLTAFTTLGAVGGPIGMAIGALLGAALSKIPAIGRLMTSIFGGKQTLDDSGFTIDRSSLSSIMANGVGARSYADITTSGGWFHGSSHSTQSTDLGDEANAQFKQIIESMASSIGTAGKLLGQNSDQFLQHLDGFVVDIGKVSLKGLTGEQIQQQLEAIFSKLGDSMAKYALPGLDDFQKVGEGYLETLVRVAAGVDGANYELDKLGVKAIKYTDIINKQGDVETEIIRQSILATNCGNGVAQMLQNFNGSATELISTYKDLLKVQTLYKDVGLNGNNLSAGSVQGAGGLSQLSDGAQTFFDNFFSDAERHAAQLADLTIQFSKLGLSVPKSKDDFKQLVISLDDGSEANNKLIGKLLSLSGAVNDLYGKADSATAKRQLEIKLVELSGNKVKSLAMTREDELAAMDESLRGLQKQIYALEDLQSAHDDLQSAYNDEVSRLTTLRDKFKDLGKGLREFIAQMGIGTNSNLSPEDKYKATRDQFNSIYGKAMTGDQDALGQLQQAAQDFLTSSKDYNATGPQYGADYDMVKNMLGQAASVAETQASIAQQQLDKMQNMVTGILDLNTTTNKFYEAFQKYIDAKNAAIAVGAPVPTSSPAVDSTGTPTGPLLDQVKAYGAQYGGDAYYFTKGINDYEGKLQAAHMLNQQLGGGMTDEQRLGAVFGHDAAYWKQVSDEFFAGGHPVARALGGATPPGLTWVGEYGKELVNFDRPAQVYSAGQSAMMVSNAQDEMKAIAAEIREMHEGLRNTLEAANNQRGAAAVANLDRLEKLEERMNDLQRSVERAS